MYIFVILKNIDPHHIFQSSIAWSKNDLHVFVFRLLQNETDPHEHVFHEIVFIESGTCEHVTVAGTQKLHPGDVIILKPRTCHQYRNPQDLQLINCLFDSHLLRDYRAFFELTPKGFDLFRRPGGSSRNVAPTLLHASPAQRTILLVFLESIMSEQAEKKTDWEAAVISQLLGFLITVGRLSENDAPTSPPVSLNNYAEKAVIETAQFLERHFREPNTLVELARQSHFSAPYLSRIFSKHMGMGIVKFQHHLRIEEACRMLRFTMDPISQIAGDVGYDELAYFSRRFRAEVGISPREYRATYNGHFKLNEAQNIRKSAIPKSGNSLGDSELPCV